jgi:ubiquitin C-terminal hydrolase
MLETLASSEIVIFFFMITGHYVTDVYHTGFSAWLHCDDSTVQVHFLFLSPKIREFSHGVR